MTAQIITGDCLDVLRTLPDQSANCCVTSPPYWGLRDYGVDGQIGLEETPEAYVARLVEVFREARRVLRDDGTLWVNLGDSYTSGGRDGHGRQEGNKQMTNRGGHGEALPSRAPQPAGLKPKDLVGIPWRVAFALQADGWYLRQDIIWHKPNPMPESVRDRCTKAHEYIFLLSKSARYWFDSDEMREEAIHSGRVVKASSPESAKNAQKGKFGATAFGFTQHDTAVGDTRNRRDVWTVATKPYPEAHFATFPPDLIRPCIKAGCPVGGTVIDPFAGAGTTGLVALEEGRDFIGIELNPEYVTLIEKRLAPVRTVATLDQFGEAEA